ncbi:hypothetical protein EYF80_034138 [Liparis tanakae]|uniref:Uncharacterized protein n=1 Tax=Liparis tanakae TaxID=230148 RepID=A0A4Z2GSC1_9TELE|nr:hypothetical protein EYF80_034138 [Liparis tanakae]
MLLEMLSKWPRNFSQGPAALMWSVVHFPFTYSGRREGNQRTGMARICSEPGVTVNWALHFRPLSRACLAREAALPMSS